MTPTCCAPTNSTWPLHLGSQREAQQQEAPQQEAQQELLQEEAQQQEAQQEAAQQELQQKEAQQEAPQHSCAAAGVAADNQATEKWSWREVIVERHSCAKCAHRPDDHASCRGSQ